MISQTIFCILAIFSPPEVSLSPDLVGSVPWIAGSGANFFFDSEKNRWILECDFIDCVPKIDTTDGFIDISISMKTQGFETVVDKFGNSVEISLGSRSLIELIFTSRNGHKNFSLNQSGHGVANAHLDF